MEDSRGKYKNLVKKEKRKEELPKERGYSEFVNLGKNIDKGINKVGSGIKSVLSNEGKITYKKDNPLKKLLKIDRPTVKVSGHKERINLMRGTW